MKADTMLLESYLEMNCPHSIWQNIHCPL